MPVLEAEKKGGLSDTSDYVTASPWLCPVRRLCRPYEMPSVGFFEPKHGGVVFMMFRCASRAGGSLGALHHAIVSDQFTRLRDGDSWWFENPGVLDLPTLSQIKATTWVRAKVYWYTSRLFFGQLSCQCRATRLSLRLAA